MARRAPRKVSNQYTDDIKRPKPQQRFDGELYSRPEPNPFTASWEAGYEDAFEGRKPEADGIKIDVIRYTDGYEAGQFDREEIDRIGSSNT